MSKVINKISRFLVGLKRCFVKFNESSLVWGPQYVSRRRVSEIRKGAARIQEGKSCEDHNFVLDTDTGESEWTVYCMLYLSTLGKPSGIPTEDHQGITPKLVHISSPSGVISSSLCKQWINLLNSI